MKDRPLVFVTGGSGYLGRALIAELVQRGHPVRALARPGSERRLPSGADAVTGDALRARTFAGMIAPAQTLVHLVGTASPSPAKAEQFVAVDLASIRATASAVAESGVQHLIYVSVAHPAPIMQAYIAARREGETLACGAAPSVTILRPWYVLGPGHRWPMLLLPLYAVLRRLPATRAGAERLGLVTLRQMVSALVHAVEHTPDGVRIVEVPEIRSTLSPVTLSGVKGA